MKNIQQANAVDNVAQICHLDFKAMSTC